MAFICWVWRVRKYKVPCINRGQNALARRLSSSTEPLQKTAVDVQHVRNLLDKGANNLSGTIPFATLQSGLVYRPGLQEVYPPTDQLP